MARRTAAQIAEEAKKLARAARRKRRRDEKIAAEVEAVKIDSVSEPSEGGVDKTALGFKQQELAGKSIPKAVKSSRAQLIQAFEDMGGIPALVAWGKKNPTEFYRIWARIIPREAEDGQTDKMPLETLLSKLAERSDQPIDQAAREIGAEALAKASGDVSLEDAVAAFRGTETVQ